jgi:hypothetical protein
MRRGNRGRDSTGIAMGMETAAFDTAGAASAERTGDDGL